MQESAGQFIIKRRGNLEVHKTKVKHTECTWTQSNRNKTRT